MFAISDVVWQALIAAIVTISMAWIAHKTTAKVEAVAVVVDKIHTLTNSAMGLQLRMNASNSKRLAALPGASQEDVEAAELAQKTLAEHDAKQAVVDSKTT